MHWASPFFCMEAKFGPSDKRIRKIDISRVDVFEKNGSICTV
jgi:hypothetical protein